MTIDAGSIIYRIDANTSGLLRAERTVGRSVAGIVSSLSKIAGGISLGLLVKQLVSVQREFDKLNAAILTSTGSVEKAGVAFKALERFAADTPFALKQSVEAFTKLVNFGLTPSERAMKSFGDTSAALGKDLIQMIEAVADAATGEFERLKEFGIKSKNQGDTIAFTFRGITTVVKNSAADIENFLIELGENNFAGAMANRMATLDGAISNLQDSWEGLLRTVSAQGPGTIINDSVRMATSAIEELITILESGQLSGIMDTIAESWRFSFGNIARDISKLTDFVLSEFKAMESEGRSVPEFISDAFFNFPANIKAAIQLATVEIAAFVDRVKAVSKQLSIDLNPFSDGVGTLESDLKRIEDASKSTINSILKDREKSIDIIDKEREAVSRLRLEFDKQTEAAKKAAEGVDVLAQFKVVVPEGIAPPPTEAEKKEKKKALSLAQSTIKRGMSPIERLELEHKELNKLKLKFAEDDKLFQDALTANEAQQAEIRQAIALKERKGKQQAQQATQDFILGSVTAITSGIMASTDEQSAAFKAAFLIEKAVAIASILVNTELAAAKVLAHDAGILGLGALVTSNIVRGIGFASAAFVGAQAISGAREHGGPVSAGKSFLVGERGPEIFTPGAGGNVTSNKESFGGTTLNVLVENNTPSQVSTQLSDNGKQLKVIINEVANQIRTNQGPIPKAMRQSTNTTFKTSR